MELTDMFQPEWGKVDVEFMAIVNLPPAEIAGRIKSLLTIGFP